MKAVLFTYKKYLEESLALSETAGYDVKEVYYIKGETNPNFFIGFDKVEKLKEKDFDALIIFDTLKSRHFIHLQKELPGKKIVDKVFLLLEIFALHAGSKEAKLQIELARLKHELPIVKDVYRRTKLGEQQGLLGAGIYGVEPQLRLYERKIARLKEDLEKLRKINESRSEERRKSADLAVAIAGYANSGKSTLFNALVKGNQKVDNSMFTTTSPKRKAVHLDDGKVLFIDTVGFIRGIPPEIVESFYVTLSEIKYADYILLLFDVTQDLDQLEEMVRSAFRTLREIGISGKPVLICLNKADLVPEEEVRVKSEAVSNIASQLYSPIDGVLAISALKGYNLELIWERVSRQMKLKRSTYLGSITGQKETRELRPT